ncbi:hypothetical protein ABT404_15940 [Streptomyces hyaluromycini]|uniref:Uncharacterized protein n=1 Tax=Streptomyces hyaluromycini TaxID=1377993 RepID=A0ABV1WW51_9ACTN
MTYPAAFPGVVAVSGTTRDGGFRAAGESGSCIAPAAPAVDIYSTRNRPERNWPKKVSAFITDRR